MKIATYADKDLVTGILSSSFKDNQSVSYILPQDDKFPLRTKVLMDYSFETCMAAGIVLISDDEKACALLKLSGKSSRPLRQAWLDLNLIWSGTGLLRLPRLLKHESTLSHIRGKNEMSYLWFIGVSPQYQHMGLGTKLLQQVLAHCKTFKVPLCLETSTMRNLPWYQQLGFKLYHTLEGDYKLFFLRYTF